MSIRSGWLVLGLSIGLCDGGFAQGVPTSRTAANQEFEVVSVRPTSDVNCGFTVQMPEIAGYFKATCASLNDLIVFSYNIQPFQLSGGPPWISKQKFDVEGKTPSVLIPVGATEGRHGSERPEISDTEAEKYNAERIRSLLSTRFSLSVTQGKSLRTVNVLKTRAKGLVVKPSTRSDSTGNADLGSIHLYGSTFDDFASVLSNITGTLFINGTALNGRYDFFLRWLQFDSEATGDNAAPSLIEALNEQLGLSVGREKREVDHLTVVSATAPDGN